MFMKLIIFIAVTVIGTSSYAQFAFTEKLKDAYYAKTTEIAFELNNNNLEPQDIQSINFLNDLKLFNYCYGKITGGTNFNKHVDVRKQLGVNKDRFVIWKNETNRHWNRDENFNFTKPSIKVCYKKII